MVDKNSIIHDYEPLWGVWKVDGLIEQGGYGEIYKVYKEEWGKRYESAVKLISISVGRSDIKEAQAVGIDPASAPEYFKSFVNNIINEVEVMYKLRGNSNIVTYEDHAVYEKSGGTGWDVLIRMEYLKPLTEYIAAGELPRHEALKLGTDICKALDACRRENIIHRDIKDSNIFVSKNGDFKLGNFAIAKELSKSGRAVPIQGSPLFMAPEVYKELSYDAAADIYSLGIVMYKLLNKGRLPFLPLPPVPVSISDTENSVIWRTEGKELPIPIDAGEKLGGIILKACSYEPKNRYKSPSELGQKLEYLIRAEARAPKDTKTVIEGNAKESISEAAITSMPDRNPSEAKANTRTSKRKLLINVCIGAAIFITGFSLAYFNALDSINILKEEAVQVTPAKPPLRVTPVAVPEVDDISGSPAEAGRGEEYYNLGISYLAKKQYDKALEAFEQAGKLGYDSSRVNGQINKVKKTVKTLNDCKKALEYYNQGNYEMAVSCFNSLAKTDPSYKSAPQYSDSLFQLAGGHNLQGVQNFNDGKFQAAIEEFDTALKVLDNVKTYTGNYDTTQYSKRQYIYTENRNEAADRISRIKECLKLADEANRSGVKLFNENDLYKAKREFEAAVKYMEEIRAISPQYFSESCEGLLQLYNDNLKRVEKRRR